MPKPLKALVSTALDMSRKARMERAREMGFDTERVLFHGSPTLDESGAFDASFPRRTDEGYMGVGAYVTPKRFIADAYAGRDGNTLELLSRSSRPLAVPYDESYRQRLKDIADGWGVDVQDIDSPEWAQEFRARAIENGYDSVVGVAPDTGEAIEMVVYDPAMLRSVNAAFDPAQRDSSNLLAGVGGAAVGAGLLAPQEAAAEFTRRRQGKPRPYRELASGAFNRITAGREADSITALPDNWMTRTGQYLTENRPSEMDALQRAVQRLDQFQSLGNWLTKTGQGDRTSVLENAAAGLDISPL